MAHPAPYPTRRPPRLSRARPRQPGLRLRPTSAFVGLACAALALPLAAQTAPPASPVLERVTIQSDAPPGPQVGGFSPEPLARTPLSASVVDASTWRERGVVRISDLTRLDPGLADAYNAPGYWDSLTVRGFVIDNRFNYRRDGLPISAETSLPLDNKQRLEVLKGLAGIEAGSASPGGLVNLVVQRPLAQARTEARLQWESAGSVLAAVDVSRRFGPGEAGGLRLNAAAERLDPVWRDAQGERGLLALAGEWRLDAGSRLEAEVEWSRRSQPSVPGFSLLGGTVPAPGDPRINLNDQPWSQPVVFEGQTGSLRWTQALAGGWTARVHAGVQQLRTDDRLAYPFGCSAQGVFDRYCSDGTFDLYDYRSDGEQRRTAALDAGLQGRLRTGAWNHELSFGVLATQYRQRMNRQANNYVGVGNVQGTAFTPADPTLTDENTDRDERSTEMYLRDRVELGGGTQAWLGLRYTRLARESVRTDGSRPTAYTQDYTTPWLALSHTIGPAGPIAYASWGLGRQSDVVPGRSRYTNAGQALPAEPSRQVELGLKSGNGAEGLPGGGLALGSWSVALFDIRQPLFTDFGACDDTAGSCTRALDGAARHRGLEAAAQWRWGARGQWGAGLGVQALQARREGASDPALNGLPPPNVPAASVKGELRWKPGSAVLGDRLADVAAVLGFSAESRRSATVDDSLRIPGYARWDAGLSGVAWSDARSQVSWRAGVDNLLDRRAWRESPVQFGHTYLYPLAPRTWRLGIGVSWL